MDRDEQASGEAEGALMSAREAVVETRLDVPAELVLLVSVPSKRGLPERRISRILRAWMCTSPILNCRRSSTAG